MRAWCRRLPAELARPLPEAMARLTPEREFPAPGDEAALRRLADLASLLERRSPLGKCLRRSLLRYHYLRREGLELRIHFGARLDDDPAGERRLTGHAWLTLDGEPYHEAPENVSGYAETAVWPDGQETPSL